MKTKEITTVKEVWICDLNYHKNLVKFCFDFLQELLMVWEAISNIPKGVSSNIQASWSWLKKTWLCLVFSTISRCLDIGWNTLPHVWYITSNSIWPNWILLYHFLIFLKNNLHFIKYFYCIAFLVFLQLLCFDQSCYQVPFDNHRYSSIWNTLPPP